jgi:hypothetical protein
MSIPLNDNDNDLEDSFTHEIGEVSMSSRKMVENLEGGEEPFTGRSH